MMCWSKLVQQWTQGEGKVLQSYNSSDTAYGALNSVKDWPLVFRGVQTGTVKAGSLVPDSEFLYDGHSIYYDHYAFLGVETSRDVEVEVSIPVTDRFSGARAIKVSGGDDPKRSPVLVTNETTTLVVMPMMLDHHWIQELEAIQTERVLQAMKEREDRIAA